LYTRSKSACFNSRPPRAKVFRARGSRRCFDSPRTLKVAGTLISCVTHRSAGLCAPIRGTIPGCYSRKPGFTETRLRPLARRRERTFWPPWVFMRERNPCFFDRLRRLGWNVRLGIEKYLLLIRSAVLGQTESINQPSHYRQTRDGDPIGDGTFLHPIRRPQPTPSIWFRLGTRWGDALRRFFEF
jgi:hypothetical protein